MGEHSTLAGQVMVRRIPIVSDPICVQDALLSLSEREWEDGSSIWLIDPRGRPIGGVHLSALLSAEPETPMRDLASPTLPIHQGETAERAALHAAQHRLSAVAVIDEQGKLVGVIPPATLLSTLRRAHVADLHQMAGIVPVHNELDELEEPPTRQARHRLPWLFVGLLGSALATLLVSRFEAELQETVALSFFIPGLVYLADAIGTQTEALVVRSLTRLHRPFSHMLALELGTGILLGLILGGLCFPAVWISFGRMDLALAVSLTLIVSGGVATSIGIAFPWMLSQMGQDPALGSGPIATVLQDVLTLLAYFLIATWLVV